MTNFFKYMSSDTAITVITNSTLKFTHPHKFNDPFDYHPTCEVEGITKYYKRVRTENNWQKELELANFKHLRKHTKVLRSSEFREAISKICAITCFSRSPFILPMWAHYGNNHDGCVLEFRHISNIELNEVISKKIRLYNSGFLIPFDVIYSDVRPKIFDKNGVSNTENTGFNSCFIKAKAWEYEQEVRVIKEGEEGIYKFPMEQLVAIHFGMRVSQDKKRAIANSVRSLNNQHFISIKLFQMAMEYNTFNLTKVAYR